MELAHNLTNLDTYFIGQESFTFGNTTGTNIPANSYIGKTSQAFEYRTVTCHFGSTAFLVYLGGYQTGNTTTNLCITAYYTKTTD